MDCDDRSLKGPLTGRRLLSILAVALTTAACGTASLSATTSVPSRGTEAGSAAATSTTAPKHHPGIVTPSPAFLAKARQLTNGQVEVVNDMPASIPPGGIVIDGEFLLTPYEPATGAAPITAAQAGDGLEGPGPLAQSPVIASLDDLGTTNYTNVPIWVFTWSIPLEMQGQGCQGPGYGMPAGACPKDRFANQFIVAVSGTPAGSAGTQLDGFESP